VAETVAHALRQQTAAEARHWLLAAEALADLDAVAAPEAWASVEDYLRNHVRGRLSGLVAALVSEATVLVRAGEAGGEIGRLRRDVLQLRAHYLQVETVLDFFGDAISSRTSPELRNLLRGFDALASDSMARTLTPLGLPSPPALVYVDKGLGAAILRAGIRLWDAGHPSPAAAIKLTRHNLSFPTAMLHETGHQVGHLSGWNGELAEALADALAPRSREVARLWGSWAGEVAADVHAFAQTGWAPVVALANVVDGTTSRVYDIRPGDPHPFPMVRVLLNVALCRSWFGPGPWDRVASAWLARHPVDRAPGDAGGVLRVSIAALGDVVDVCTRRAMAALGGRPLAALLDPRLVSPAALRALATDAGGSLETSSYLRRREPLRVLAVLAGRSLTDPARAGAHRATLRRWVADLGADSRSQQGASGAAPPRPLVA
jgi:hypothetical protein